MVNTDFTDRKDTMTCRIGTKYERHETPKVRDELVKGKQLEREDEQEKRRKIPEMYIYYT